MDISCQLLVRRKSAGHWTWWQLAAIGVGLCGDLLRKCSNVVVACIAQVCKSGMGNVVGKGLGVMLADQFPMALRLRADVMWRPVVAELGALQLVVAGAVRVWLAGA